MITKIAAVAIWASVIAFHVSSYMLAGFRSLVVTLLASTIWAAMAMILKVDRDKVAEELSLYKAEVWNLRIGIQRMQETIQVANSELTTHGKCVHMPEIMPTVLPSVFDRKEQ